MITPPFCAMAPFVAGAVVLGTRAANADTRSGKLGTAAAACGVAGFAPALLGDMFRDPRHMGALAGCGVITLLFAVAAVLLAVRAFRVRRREPGGVNGLYPAAGLLLGAANLLCGVGVLAMGSGLLVPAGGTPWTWRSAEHGFEVTVPSDRWATKRNPAVLAEFSSSRPLIIASVVKAVPAETEAEYEAAVGEWKRFRDDTPTAHPDERTGPNRHGHPHRLYMGEARSAGGWYFFGVSLTRVRGKAVLAVFEGHYQMTSEAGRAQEAQALRTQADEFLGSVK